jgi:hypothetical protein
LSGRPLGGDVHKVGRGASLFGVGGCHRGSLVEIVVGGPLFPLLSAQPWLVRRVPLRLELLPWAGGAALSACLVGHEVDPRPGPSLECVAKEDVAVAELNVRERAYADDRDCAAVTVLREARTHSTTLETKEDEMSEATDNQLEFVHKLERLADYAGKEADDDFRELIAEIQDEFNLLKRGAVRDGLETDERLTAQDVFNLGAEIGQDFPKAQRGCEVFVSVYFTEKIESASLN